GRKRPIPWSAPGRRSENFRRPNAGRTGFSGLFDKHRDRTKELEMGEQFLASPLLAAGRAVVRPAPPVNGMPFTITVMTPRWCRPVEHNPDLAIVTPRPPIKP